MRILAVALALATLTASSQNFTLEQVFRAPFSSDLTAAPTGETFAWVTNLEGRRNLYSATSAQTQKQLTHFTDDDGQELSDLGFTHNGTQIIFTRGGSQQGSEHPVPNPSHLLPNAEQKIFAVSLSGQLIEIATGHSPAVSPTEDRIAYIRGGQIYLAPIQPVTIMKDGSTEKPSAATAEARPLFQLRGTQSNLRWSPNGQAIAFITQRGDHAFIVVYHLDTRQLTFLDPGTSLDSEPAWSPDSRKVVFIRNPTGFDDEDRRADQAGYPWQIRIADATTGEGSMLWQADKGVGSLYRELAAKDNLTWTTDNRILFPWEKTGWLHLYSLSTHPRHFDRSEAKRNEVEKAASPADLTPGNFEVEHIAYDASRNLIYFSSNQNDIDRRHIWSVSPNGSKPARQWTSGEGIEVRPAISASGTLAFLQADATHPVVPATLHAALSNLVPADFPSSQLVTPQQVIFPATDALAIHGQLFLPTNHRLEKNGKHPAVLFIHGGSRRQMYLGWNPMEYYSNAYAFNQYLCSLGYIVLSVNYRSGIGYGMQFRQAKDYGFFGASEYRDILGAASYLKTRADVDAARIGSWGGSYGGYLTALALARNSETFVAGVDFHGVHDWSFEMGFSRNSDSSTSSRVTDRTNLANLAWQSSPMASLDTWRSPVLLIQGDDDRNVLFSQTVRLAQALRDRNVDVEEKVFPDEIHDFLLHANWLTTYRLSADFLNRKLANK